MRHTKIASPLSAIAGAGQAATGSSWSCQKRILARCKKSGRVKAREDDLVAFVETLTDGYTK
jgi:hypothetical protein